MVAGLASALGADKSSLEFSANPTTDDLFRAHVFQEPLVVVGAQPSAAENSELAAALLGYSKRSGPDDFSAITGFLSEHPESSWNAALLTDLGLEYYNTAHYSLALDAWSNAWSHAAQANDAKSVALVSRAFGELIKMDSRLGRMDEIERLLNSIGNKPLPAPAAEHVVEAREALWNMKNRPEISFRCGPLALRSIRVALGLPGSSDEEILKSASTQRGCSLPQVAELSLKIGLNYQMAFRNSGDFVVPSVVHWKVGHYAAMIRKVGDLYELHDPTFGNNTWATMEALEAETTGYFLVAAGPLPQGWRTVDEREGAAVWGKGLTTGNDPQHITKRDLATGGTCPAQGTGMATAKIHIMDVNLDITDNPLGYNPPTGPPVQFVIRYNQLDIFQPGNFSYMNFGPLWTSDWISYITDDPTNQLADVNLYVPGGGQRTYIDFNTNTQSFDYQQYDQNLLTRTGPASYQLLSGDGSEMIFSRSDGSTGSSRNIFLTQEIDPQGNAITFSYDTNMCITQITDAIGQVTTLTYGLPALLLTNAGTGEVDGDVPADPYKLTKVTDPFGRSATLTYQPIVVAIQYTLQAGGVLNSAPLYAWGLSNITDVVGITSSINYQQIDVPVTQNYSFVDNYVSTLTTPYGTTSFNGNQTGNTRYEEIAYPDGSRQRVEYNQSVTNVPVADPFASVPVGMLTDNQFLQDRDTYYWDRNGCALAYGDYTKARLFHFLHTEDLASTAGALESFKLPLEGRVWFDYAGQSSSIIINTNTLPAHIGRVLDDGSTQLYTCAYNGFGHLLNSIDPLGRALTYDYDTNGIDLLNIRQTRAGNNELLAKATYNSQHCLLTVTDASGQTTTMTYNSRGQLLTVTDPKNETTTLTYNPNGYLVAINGPLPGNDSSTYTYDAIGRVRSMTDLSGYTVNFAYDNLDRITSMTHPDGTSSQFNYNLLDCSSVQDRAGRQTFFQHNNMRELTQITDPLGRVTMFNWCNCGSLASITDPMGRVTIWNTDLQGRRTSKKFADGSTIQYQYENTTSRLLQITDERQQSTVVSRNLDNTISSVSYGNAVIPTPSVSLTYDPNYRRVVSMTDGIGTATYNYFPISSPPVLGAGRLAGVEGPLNNETVDYGYDELGRRVQTSIDGVSSTRVFDATDRFTSISNVLGAFTYAYDGNSDRLLNQTEPDGLTATMSYGNIAQDFAMQQISNATGATPLSQFIYGHDIHRMQITNWSQQAGISSPSVFSFGYDAVNQLLSASVTGAAPGQFAYTYDPAGNRLTELAGGAPTASTYNALNQISTTANSPVNSRTNQWDAENRLAVVNAGPNQTEFGYDGLSRLAYIRQLQNGSQASFRWFAWSGGNLSEERDASGTNITKRFYGQGVQLETGATAGSYYYTRDHLGSIHELIDSSGNVRARYSYDPFGLETKVSGDLDADFGFAGMFWSSEASLAITHFRAYDPVLGRWLSRDPLRRAELREGPNLYAYVKNDPVDNLDPEGLCVTTVDCTCEQQPCTCAMAGLVPAVQAVAPVVAATTAIVEEAGGPEAVVQDVDEVGQLCPQGLQTLAGIGPDTMTGLEDTAAAGLRLAPDIIQDVEEAVTPELADEVQEAQDEIDNSDWAVALIRARLNLPEWANVGWWNIMNRFPYNSWWYDTIMTKLSESDQ